MSEDSTSESLIVHSGNTKFKFSGDGTEYFKIWITNIALTILTLGIYSAWATVRNRQYFYSNTYLAEEHFSYLANPIAILKGRVIAVTIFVIYSILINYYPLAGLIILLLILLTIPYFVLRSMEFQRRNSAYRGVRFNFEGSLGSSAKVVFLWPFLSYITAGLLVPLYLVRLNEFAIGNSSLGSTKMNFIAGYRDYAPAFFGFVFLWLIGFTALIFSSESAFLAIPGIGLILISIVFWQYMTFKILFSSISLGEHKLRTDLEFVDYLKIAISNYILILITLGLFYPFARVRITNYIVNQLSMDVVGSLDEFIATETKNVAALGQELGDVMDFDIS